eukprot:Skav230424  [mRNA]  locus=scaffold1601:20003:23738:+ [translate_table: standard]
MQSVQQALHLQLHLIEGISLLENQSRSAQQVLLAELLLQLFPTKAAKLWQCDALLRRVGAALQSLFLRAHATVEHLHPDLQLSEFFSSVSTVV